MENPVITEPAAEQLRSFLDRGGKLIVDDLRVPGKYYGHFGVLDQVVPQTVALRLIGYWAPDCLVRTDHPAVLATVYRKPGKALWPSPVGLARR